MIPAAELERLRRELETALGEFNRAQEAFDAAVAEHNRARALAAALRSSREQLAVATKAYREAVLDFVEPRESGCR